jgi:long-chain acyl-CoA synthetase
MFNPVLLHEYLSASAARLPDKTALICGDDSWTYSALDSASSQFAHALRNLGVNRGDRVIVFLQNSPECVISIYSILKAGAVFVVLNPSVKAKKLAYIIRDSGAKVLVADTSRADVVREAMQDLSGSPRIVWVGNTDRIPAVQRPDSTLWDDVCGTVRDSGHGMVPDLNNNGAQAIDYDLAALIYTSGSTGEPKGVMCPHFNMVAAARSIIQYLGNSREDVLLCVLPLSFGYGLYQVLTAFMLGGTVVLEKSFAFPIKVLERIERERVTGFAIVPTIATMLLQIQNIGKFDLSSLRYLTNAAAALPVDHIVKLRELFPHVRLYSMYGLTECVRALYLAPEELARRPSSVGKAIPNCEVFVVDENGRRVSPGEVGELVVRGANVMRGYWNAPELTAKAFRQGLFPGEALLHSGDLFRQDEDGFLYFVSRRDEMIKTKGERVSPKEIENALCDLKGVLEAAVVGVPDEILGQALKACIVRESGHSLTPRDILKHCTNNLEAFMVPKHIEFLEEIPKTANGKIDKKALTESR